MNSTQLRNRACRMAQEDPGGALREARRIPDPWFRTQALAEVARCSADDHVERLVREALASAAACDDGYKRAAVAAWPIRVLVERGRTRLAAAALGSARQEALGATPAGSRAEALFGLFNAGWDLGPSTRLQLVSDLLALEGERTHWRAARAIVRSLERLGASDRPAAKGIASRIVDDGLRGRALRALAP